MNIPQICLINIIKGMWQNCFRKVWYEENYQLRHCKNNEYVWRGDMKKKEKKRETGEKNGSQTSR